MVYYLNTGQQGRCDCERVHREGCTQIGNVEQRRPLGQFKKIKEALVEAQLDYPLAELCLSCYWND